MKKTRGTRWWGPAGAAVIAAAGSAQAGITYNFLAGEGYRIFIVESAGGPLMFVSGPFVQGAAMLPGPETAFSVSESLPTGTLPNVQSFSADFNLETTATDAGLWLEWGMTSSLAADAPQSVGDGIVLYSATSIDMSFQMTFSEASQIRVSHSFANDGLVSPIPGDSANYQVVRFSESSSIPDFISGFGDAAPITVFDPFSFETSVAAGETIWIRWNSELICFNDHFENGWNRNQTGVFSIEVLDPPCAADLDGNSIVDVFDLLAYLDHWFAGDLAAELTGDEPALIDVFDLLAYLDQWFAGC